MNFLHSLRNVEILGNKANCTILRLTHASAACERWDKLAKCLEGKRCVQWLCKNLVAPDLDKEVAVNLESLQSRL